MGDAVWVECQWCGKLHRVKTAEPPEDKLFIKLHCPRCHDEVNHLFIGKYTDEVYLYGNANLDERFFIY